MVVVHAQYTTQMLQRLHWLGMFAPDHFWECHLFEYKGAWCGQDHVQKFQGATDQKLDIIWKGPVKYCIKVNTFSTTVLKTVSYF